MISAISGKTEDTICAGYEYSHEFDISDHPFSKAKEMLLAAFYYERCGCEIDERFAGDYARPECHTGLSYLVDENGKRTDIGVDCTGGWHCARDYGKYTIPAATALGHLLYAYTLFPDNFADDTRYPMGGNATPDILDECRYEILWLLKMQRDDGAVHHKTTCRHSTDSVMPQDEKDEMLLFDVSTTATAVFCAVIALAANVYYQYDERLSKKLVSACTRAWDWLERNPEFIGFKNPPDVTTGEYSEGSADNEIFWAAAEMYKLTGDQRYVSYVYQYHHSQYLTTFGWQDVSGFGALAYLTNPETADNDAIATFIKNRFISEADRI